MSPIAAAQPISNKTKAMKEKPSTDDGDTAFQVVIGLACLGSLLYGTYSILNALHKSGYLSKAYDFLDMPKVLQAYLFSVFYAMNLSVVGVLLYAGGLYERIMENDYGLCGRVIGSWFTVLSLSVFLHSPACAVPSQMIGLVLPYAGGVYITLLGVFRPTTMRFLTLVVGEKELDKTKIMEEKGVKVSAVTQTIAEATVVEEKKEEELQGLFTPPEETKVNPVRDDISDTATEPFVEV